MIKDNKLYLTGEELDTTKAVLTELMEISNDGLAKVMLKSIVDIIDGIKQLGKETNE